MNKNTKILISVAIALGGILLAERYLHHGANLGITEAETKAGTETDTEPKTSRWRFLDGEKGAEADRKQQIIAKIEQFWKDFKTSGPGRLKPEKVVADKETPSWMDKNLAKIDPSLEWEMGGGFQETTPLVITRGFSETGTELAETTVERAVPMPGWTVAAYREAREPAELAKIYQHRCGEKLPPFSFRVMPGESNSVDLAIESPQFEGTNREEDRLTALLILDIVLGERNLTTWVDKFTTTHSEGPTAAKFNSEKTARNFASSFNQEKAKIISKLPTMAFRLSPQLESEALVRVKESDVPALLKLERCRLTYVTTRPELASNFNTDTPFFSERYTNTGEKFAYLQLFDPKDYSVEYRERLEVDLNQALLKSGTGSLVGSGRGNPASYYFDLCLSDPDKAIPVLKQFCIAQKLPSQCWLRFYDHNWRHEWVRMLPDTPDLKHPEIEG